MVRARRVCLPTRPQNLRRQSNAPPRVRAQVRVWLAQPLLSSRDCGFTPTAQRPAEYIEIAPTKNVTIVAGNRFVDSWSALLRVRERESSRPHSALHYVALTIAVSSIAVTLYATNISSVYGHSLAHGYGEIHLGVGPGEQRPDKLVVELNLERFHNKHDVGGLVIDNVDELRLAGTLLISGDVEIRNCPNLRIQGHVPPLHHDNLSRKRPSPKYPQIRVEKMLRLVNSNVMIASESTNPGE